MTTLLVQEIGVWAYRRQQWLCLMLEKLRVPFPLLLPKPVFIIVDQFEELLKKLWLRDVHIM